MGSRTVILFEDIVFHINLLLLPPLNGKVSIKMRGGGGRRRGGVIIN